MIRERWSPNIGPRPAAAPIDTIILHYTGMQSGQDAIDRLCDPAPPTNNPVSAHYVVDENGDLWRLVPDAMRGQHAGVSHWRGREGLNDCSIGVEIVNPGHEWGYRAFPQAQIATVIALCRDVQRRFPIDPRNIIGHSDIAPHRKQDPGELFPWQQLADAGIGIWPVSAGAGLNAAPDDVRAALIRIGYALPVTGPLDDELQSVLRAFQRHWRPETINGLPDAGTLRRMSGLLAHPALA